MDDLHELFFSMRDELRGKGIVSEVAHFIAHPGPRTQGMTWQEACDAFAFLKFRVSLGNSPITTASLSDSVPRSLMANLRRMRKSRLRELDLSRGEAMKIVEKVVNRSVPTGPSRISRLKVESRQEEDVLVYAASHMKGGPLFDDNDLFEDFYRALIRQNNLQAIEKQALKKAKAAISLFALTAMHNRSIDLGDGSIAHVSIVADIKNNLGIFAHSEVLRDYGGGPVIAFIWLFETGLPTTRYCDQPVIPLSRVPFVGDFEVTAGPRLALIH
jgi:hypothetical protein